MSSSGRDLYYLWEQQQWQAGKIDLSRDAPAPIQAAVETLLVLKDALTSALVPFVDVIPDEEDQVFLSTELVDEARHAVLFDRVLAEVLGVPGSMEARVALAGERLSEAWSRRLGLLGEASASVRAGGQEALVAGIRVTHIEIKGAAKELLEEIRAAAGSMPGLIAGLDLVDRDEGRHLAFAHAFLGTESRIA